MFSKRKFVMIVGDDGAILTLLEGSRVKERLFTTSASMSERREFNNLFLRYPKVPIYLMLDTLEQTYTKQTLPAVSIFEINKYVERRLERDFSETDIKGALQLGRVESGRKDWLYMFASTPVSSAIDEWVDYLLALPNDFQGIYMLPVEMENVVAHINRYLFKRKRHQPKWQFFVTHDKTGGFRQVILQEGKVIFTRLIRPSKENIPEIIAGNIEQEIFNTTDYLRRLSLGEDQTLHIVVVVANEIRECLQSADFRGHDLAIYTPFELAELLKLKQVASLDDKFADLVIASSFAMNKPVLKLFSPKTKKQSQLASANKVLDKLISFSTPLLLIYCLYLGWNVVQTKKNMDAFEDSKKAIESKWSAASDSDQYDILDANRISDAIEVYDIVNQFEVSPLPMMARLQNVFKGYAYTTNINWSYQYPIDDTNGTERGVFGVDFYNTGKNLEELFENFDAFSNVVKTSFSEYKVEHSKLPSKITFGSKAEIIKVQLLLESKIEDGVN